jgi:hypothetical protein
VASFTDKRRPIRKKVKRLLPIIEPGRQEPKLIFMQQLDTDKQVDITVKGVFIFFEPYQ